MSSSVEQDDNSIAQVIKRRVVIKQLFGMEKRESIRKSLVPKSRYKYAYVLLDTSKTDPNLTGNKKYGWRFSNSLALEPGVVNSFSDVRDLVGMRIYPITMVLTPPIQDSERTKIYYNRIVNLNNSFTVLIHEFQAQSYIARDGRRFHFALFPSIMNLQTVVDGFPTITPVEPYIEFVTSGKCNGWYWFEKPITSFSTLTVSIGNPFDLLDPNVGGNRMLIPIQLVYLDNSIDN